MPSSFSALIPMLWRGPARRPAPLIDLNWLPCAQDRAHWLGLCPAEKPALIAASSRYGGFRIAHNGQAQAGLGRNSINYLQTAGGLEEGGGHNPAWSDQGSGWRQGRLVAIGAWPGRAKADGIGFGSGTCAPAALSMLKTGCRGDDSPGRHGNPIFAEAAALFRGAPVPSFSNADVAAAARRHLERSARFLGEKTACVEFRKQFCAYSKGRQGGARLRERAVHCSTLAEFGAVLDEFASGS